MEALSPGDDLESDKEDVNVVAAAVFSDIAL
jgi:hypothetical protein